MKNKKSYGLDGISKEILKCCSPVIEPDIAAALSKCIEGRTFPKCLKIAKVIPIFKKGDKRKPENYRPISLFSSISKDATITHDEILREKQYYLWKSIWFSVKKVLHRCNCVFYRIHKNGNRKSL